MKNRKGRKKVGRPLMVFAVGLTIASTIACNESESYGNPKMPPDLSGVINGDLGNPKTPPDLGGTD